MAYQEKSRFEDRAGGAVAFLSSLVFHVALLLILACCIYTAGAPSQGLLMSAHLGDTPETTLDAIQTFELAPQDSEPAEVEQQAEFSLEVDLDQLFDKPVDQSGAGVEAALASLSTGTIAEGLDQSGKGRGASFFGTYAQGNRFVYVLDSSRSMRGDRWIYACSQLIDSLHGLKPGQEFIVICFDMQTSFVFNMAPQQVQYIQVNEAMVARVRRWLQSRTLGGATMPADALQYALELRPDAIFLLSDGELQDNSRLMLQVLNGFGSGRRPVPIHTVHLFSREGRQTLQQIALENKGTFTPISDH